MMEHPGRGEQKYRPHEPAMVLRGGYHDHGLGNKAGEQRERRDGGRANHAESGRPRHGLYSPPSSEPLHVPVRYRTAPIDMNKSAL